MRVHVHEIYIYDEDPVRVDRYSETGLGVQFQLADDDVGPVTVTVPWSQITKIRSWRYDTDDDAPGAEVEPDANSDDEPVEPPAADPAKTDDGQGQGDSGGNVKEWTEASNADMRTWAQTQGLAVSTSGPVSKDVATKFAAAHSD
jgi:hypothetical protein